MGERALKETDYLTINGRETLPDGTGVITIKIAGFDDHYHLPYVISFNGVKYGKTGWNSDHMLTYYRTDAELVKIEKRK